MIKKVTLNDIITFLGKEIKAIYGNPEGINIHYLKDPQNVDEYTLDWVNPQHPDKQQIAESSKAKTIIAGPDIEYTDELKLQGKVILIVDKPKLAIAKVGHNFFMNKVKPGIHPTAVIHPEAIIGMNVFIGVNASVGKCKIGDDVQIHANVVLCDNVVLHNNVYVHANSSIGVEGLGCEREKDGGLVKFPHLGGVIIENDVDIGAGCIIAKGALSVTILGNGSKINAGSYIAHNVVLGKNVWISPKVNIAGSVKVGDNVTIFSGTVIRDQRLIGKGAVIGMGAVVTKNIPANETWVGNPAKKLEKRNN